MEIKEPHFSYCTNIHPVESWEETFKCLKEFLPAVKSRVSASAPFGAGLRLSALGCEGLSREGSLEQFIDWLKGNDLYVFTLNGFPYGNFHGTRIKDQVHNPDWTKNERVQYTRKLAFILARLLPAGIEGGISTSPLSYKFWFRDQAAKDEAIQACLKNLISVIGYLHLLRENTGCVIHIDLEPEPDGLLENSEEFISFYNDKLLHEGCGKLAAELGILPGQADDIIRRHVRLCYDTCHVALEFEEPAELVQRLRDEYIQIGKVQISSALKADLPAGAGKKEVLEELRPFAESAYLHQVRIKTGVGELIKLPDLDIALSDPDKLPAGELRTHFHVPVFMEKYGKLESTRPEIEKTLAALTTEDCRHFEVETYTWDVLPAELKTDLKEFIVRELNWAHPLVSNLKDPCREPLSLT